VKRLGQDEDVDIYDVVLDTGDKINISSRTIDIMNWSREQVNEIMGFENSPLVGSISRESYMTMDPELNTQGETPVDLSPILMEEFQESMVANGYAAEGFHVDAEPMWAQWATL
jgi:hypothetical protein